MRTRGLTLSLIILLTVSGTSYPAAGNDALSAIREITAEYTNSTRKRTPKSSPQPDQPTPAQPKPAPKTDSPKPAAPSAKSDISQQARNIYALFMRANPKLEQAKAKKYAEIVLDVSAKYKQNPYVIAAIIVHESTVNNKAVSKGGDYGLMQVRWKIHEKAIKQRFPNIRNADGMFDAETNIMFGTEIFSDCMRRSDNDVAKGLMRYSAGNTKMRDKVLATVRELRANDNASKTVDIIKQKKKGK